MAVTAISVLGTYYVQVPITAPVNPTSASVSFAFIGPYNTTSQANENPPTSSTTWYEGSWVSGVSYAAQCLVGPSGVVALATGSYSVWVEISGTTTGETPVLWASALLVS